MDNLSDLIIPAASAVAGSGATALLVKVAVSRWFAAIEKDSETLRQVDKQQAVMMHRLEKIEKDINGIGFSLRKLASPTK